MKRETRNGHSCEIEKRFKPLASGPKRGGSEEEERRPLLFFFLSPLLVAEALPPIINEVFFSERGSIPGEPRTRTSESFPDQ
jgi:hypothetical protein